MSVKASCIYVTPPLTPWQFLVPPVFLPLQGLVFLPLQGYSVSQDSGLLVLTADALVLYRLQVTA